MKRRWFLTAALGGVAGCVEPLGRMTPTPTPNGGVIGGSVANVDLPVPQSALIKSVPRDGIPAIIDPVFEPDWSSLEPSQSNAAREEVTVRPKLHAEDPVIGIVRGGTARAYPLRVLNWHEIVNDHIDGPLLVAYCPLCRSGITAVRRVQGTETVFGVSGELWMANLVMYDRLTDSRWSQVAATAIRGPATGTTLALLPSTITSWESWRRDHPGTTVLVPPPKSNTLNGRDATRDYAANPYAGYATSRNVGPGSTFNDARLHPKTLVIGVTAGDNAKAYPLPRVVETGVVNDTIGNRPVVVTVARDDTLVAYSRRVDGSTLTFADANDDHLAAAGSRWQRASGHAVDGPYEGVTLTQANNLPPLFWFSWLDFHPDTTVFDG